MMTPELRSITSVDIDDLETWRSGNEAFWLILDLRIGSDRRAGADTFNLYVCNPQALEQVVAEKGLRDGRHLLILDEFDYARVQAWIDSVLGRSSGADWTEVSGRLSRYFEWEFEDYIADPNGRSAGGFDTRISGEPGE